MRDHAVIVLLPETGRRGPDVLHAASPVMVLQSLTVFLPSPNSLSLREAHGEADR